VDAHLRVDRVPRRVYLDTRRRNGQVRTAPVRAGFWMSMFGPWGDGTVDYTGTMTISPSPRPTCS
jgi:hypothetical protein